MNNDNNNSDDESANVFENHNESETVIEFAADNDNHRQNVDPKLSNISDENYAIDSDLKIEPDEAEPITHGLISTRNENLRSRPAKRCNSYNALIALTKITTLHQNISNIIGEIA